MYAFYNVERFSWFQVIQPECLQMVIKNLSQWRALENIEKWIPYHSQSLPFESVRLNKLFVATMWNIFRCRTGCWIIVIKSCNSVKNINSIRYSSANRPTGQLVLCQLKVTAIKLIWQRFHIPNGVLPRS